MKIQIINLRKDGKIIIIMTRKEFIKKVGQMACAIPLLPYTNVFEKSAKQGTSCHRNYTRTMKEIIDITEHKLCIFEFDTDRKLSVQIL